jgi:hypothetical protein
MVLMVEAWVVIDKMALSYTASIDYKLSCCIMVRRLQVDITPLSSDHLMTLPSIATAMIVMVVVVHPQS